MKIDAVPSIFNEVIESNATQNISNEAIEINDDNTTVQKCMLPACIEGNLKVPELQATSAKMKIDHDLKLQFFQLKVDALETKLKKSIENERKLNLELKKTNQLLKQETNEVNSLKIEIEQLKSKRHISAEAPNVRDSLSFFTFTIFSLLFS